MDRIQIPRTSARKSYHTSTTRKPNVDADSVCPAWGIDSGGTVFIRCACGMCMDLQHTIEPNGDVNPSIFHDRDGCGWHVMGTLVGWDGGKAETKETA
jgi:hypothetical protein